MSTPSPEPPPGSGPRRTFAPPPAEPVSRSSFGRNLVLAGILSGAGCLLVLLAGIALVIVLEVSGGGGTGEDDGAAGASHLCGTLAP